MKKMLFMAVLVIGGGSFLKNHMVVTPSGQVMVAGYNVPLPAAIQNSPVMGMVTMMASMAGTQSSPVDTRPGAGQAGRPAMPNVTSAGNTYNPNAPAANAAGAPGAAAGQLNAVAKALR